MLSQPQHGFAAAALPPRALGAWASVPEAMSLTLIPDDISCARSVGIPRLFSACGQFCRFRPERRMEPLPGHPGKRFAGNRQLHKSDPCIFRT